MRASNPFGLLLPVALSLIAIVGAGPAPTAPAADEPWARVTEDDRAIKVETDKLEAVIPKKNPKQWMTGIEKGSFLDKTTGFREVGDGLMVVDWLMEPGSDKAWDKKIIVEDGNGDIRYRQRCSVVAIRPLARHLHHVLLR